MFLLSKCEVLESIRAGFVIITYDHRGNMLKYCRSIPATMAALNDDPFKVVIVNPATAVNIYENTKMDRAIKESINNTIEAMI